tara:strand:- start:376 stop:738 length:363 start_codon:yes stop_codon:yes gene_type:complete
MSSDLVAVQLACGPLILFFSFIFSKYQPKKISTIYGYRTTRSMSNNDIWEFANKVSAKYMIIASLATILFQLLGIIFNYTSEDFVLVSYSFLIISLGLSIWKTEIEINKFFDKEGNRLKI